MDLRELIDECRRVSRDATAPYFWKDEVWARALSEAEAEACVRARLIEDDESDFCYIDLEPGVQRYRLDARIIKVIEVRNEDGRLITGYDIGNNDLTLGVAPTVAQTLRLLVYRRPLAKLEGGDDALLSIPGVGRKALSDLKRALRARGFDVPKSETAAE